MNKFFVVYNRGKLAQHPHCKVNKSWDNCVFNTLAEARDYVIKWLGQLVSKNQLNQFLMAQMPVNYDYSGYGDLLEIKEVDEDVVDLWVKHGLI